MKTIYTVNLIDTNGAITYSTEFYDKDEALKYIARDTFSEIGLKAVLKDGAKRHFPSYKYSHLFELITDDCECNDARKTLLNMPTMVTPQNVESSDGDYIQSILWLDCIEEVLEELDELIEEEPSNENLTSIQTLLNSLGDKMRENDINFLFI
jgi:hypothetical protein